MTRLSGREPKGIEYDPAEGRTKQSMRDDCDINKIMARYSKTGDERLLNISNAIPQYGDFSKVGDYLTARLQIKSAEELFAQLPSSVRKMCGHDEAIFLEKVANKDQDLLIKLGLVVPSKKGPTLEEVKAAQKPTPKEGAESPIQGGE